MRPQTGELLALVGGRDYRVSQFDRCTQARRQTGSVFKPFVYIAALEPVRTAPAITLAELLDDSPFEIETPNGPWRPRTTTASSTARCRCARRWSARSTWRPRDSPRTSGIARVADVARRLGIASPLPLVPSLALGTADVSPLEIARAYATIASGGIRPEIQTIEDLVDVEGHTLERRRLGFERVLDSGTAFLATSMLEGVAERGTAAGVRATGLRGPVAAKTGTTDGERDLWFVGFTPELVAVVWIGFDEPRSIGRSEQRGRAARLAALRRGGDGRARARRLPAAARGRARRDRAGDGRAGARGLSGTAPGVLPGGHAAEQTCPAGTVAGAGEDESPAIRRRFFEWLRRQL